MKTLIRTQDKMVFEVDPKTLKAKQCSYYDAYCYSDPRKDVTYMDFSEWTLQLNKQWNTEYELSSRTNQRP